MQFYTFALFIYKEPSILHSFKIIIKLTYSTCQTNYLNTLKYSLFLLRNSNSVTVDAFNRFLSSQI